MSFQAYLDTIKEKTGLGPDDFRALASQIGLLEPEVKPAQIIAWVKEEFGLGQGHAMAIVAVLGKEKGAGLTDGEKIAAHFAGGKSRWQLVWDELLHSVEKFGPVKLAPTNSYISLLRGTAKFAIVQPSAGRLDIGIKLPGARATPRFEAAGSWNLMVTHRARLAPREEIDAELVDWLRRAYDRAG